jgi:hypothetical protein
VFGWTQLVYSTDSASGGFEMDPIAIYQRVPTPFAWFGIRPELSGAPAREPGTTWAGRRTASCASDRMP